VHKRDGAKSGILAYGSTEEAVREAVDLLAAKGKPLDTLRVRSIPFQNVVYEYLVNHDKVYVVEQNRDGQMRQLLSMTYPDCAGKLVQVAHTDGMPLSAKWIVDAIQAKEEK